MRIAIVYPFFAHYRGPIIESLSAVQDFEFFFLAGVKTNPPFSSLKLHNFEKGSNFIALRNFWFFKYFLWQPDLVRALRQGQFDGVIFLSDWKYLSIWPAVFYLRMKRTPVWFWSHGLLNKKRTLNNSIKYFFHTIFNAGGFLYSSKAREIMLAKGYKANLSVVYNSLDYQKQKGVAKSIENGDITIDVQVDKPYVIFTGRLVPERKLELLFDAIKTLADEHIILNALIIGDGPHSSTLMSYVDKIGVSGNVVFYGPSYDERIIGYYFMNALACVYPGPIGLTIIHSMTYGTPVITNDDVENHKPEIEALIEGVNGFLFKDDDVISLTTTIKKVLTLTDEQKLQLKQNAQKTVKEKFTPSYQARIIKDTIMSRLNKK